MMMLRPVIVLLLLTLISSPSLVFSPNQPLKNSWRWRSGSALAIPLSSSPTPHISANKSVVYHVKRTVSKWREKRDSNTSASFSEGNYSNESVVAPPNIEEAIGIIKQENFTRLALTLKDPANRGYVVVMLMVFSAIVSVYGYHMIKTWLFFGGFVAVSTGFYLSAPHAVPFFDLSGNEDVRVTVSLVLGVLAGGVAVWALKVGVFLTGSCLGLGFSLAARTTLAHMNVFQSELEFVAFYVVSAAVGGFLALCKEAPIIILATSFFGCFGIFVGAVFVLLIPQIEATLSFFDGVLTSSYVQGVGYFEHCPFLDTVTHVEKAVEAGNTKTPDGLPSCAKVQGILFLVLTLATSAIQFGILQWCCSSDEQDGGKASSRRRRRKNKSRVAAQEIELLSMTIDSFSDDDDDYDNDYTVLKKRLARRIPKKKRRRPPVKVTSPQSESVGSSSH
eukprot:m.203328 g.203328  ORF g.203328 m.203328 type:complete len:448 (+) comp15761_c0_seq4:245-1588(+)